MTMSAVITVVIVAIGDKLDEHLRDASADWPGRSFVSEELFVQSGLSGWGLRYAPPFLA
jgi:hypothetical protein